MEMMRLPYNEDQMIVITLIQRCSERSIQGIHASACMHSKLRGGSNRLVTAGVISLGLKRIIRTRKDKHEVENMWLKHVD